MRRFIPVIVTTLLVTTIPAPAAELGPPPRLAFTLDQLDPANITAEERFEGQPKELVAVLGSSRGQHAGPAVQAALSPDGKLVASGGGDTLVRLWDARTLRPLAVLKGHTQPVVRLVFSPDGKWLATVAGIYGSSARYADRSVRVWAVDGANSRLAAVGKPRERVDEVLDVRFTSDSRGLLTVFPRGEVRSLDLTAKPPAERTLFRLEPDQHQPSGHRHLSSAHFAPDGRTLLVRLGGWSGSGEEYGEYRTRGGLWDVATGKPLPVQRRETGKLLPVPRWGQDFDPEYHHFSPDGKFLIVWCGIARRSPPPAAVWDLSGKEAKEAAGLPAKYFPFAWDDPAAVVPTARLTEIGPRKFPFAQAANRRRYAWGDWDSSDSVSQWRVSLWDVEGGKAVRAGTLSLPPPFGPRGYLPVVSQGLSTDGAVLAGVTANWVRVWDLRNDGPVERAGDGEPRWATTGIAFGPDGRSIIAAGDGLARWDLSTNPPRVLLTPIVGQPSTSDGIPCVFARDGRRLARMVPKYGPVVVVDASTGQTVHRIPRLVPGDLEQPFYTFSLSPGLNDDGTVLAESVSVSPGNGLRPIRTVRVWDLRRADPKLTARLKLPDALSVVVTPSPNGRRVAIAAVGEVAVWDVSRVEPTVVARFPGGGDATVLAFTPDGKRLAARYRDRVQVWDLDPKARERWQAAVKEAVSKTEEQPGPFERWRQEAVEGMSVLQFTPDGRLIVLGGDGLSLWDAAGKLVVRWPGLAGVRAVAVSPDGRHLATANPNGTAYILRLPTADR